MVGWSRGHRCRSVPRAELWPPPLKRMRMSAFDDDPTKENVSVELLTVNHSSAYFWTSFADCELPFRKPTVRVRSRFHFLLEWIRARTGGASVEQATDSNRSPGSFAGLI